MKAAHRRTFSRSIEDHLDEYDELMLDDLKLLLECYIDSSAAEDINPKIVMKITEDWKNALPDPGQWAEEQAYLEYENHLEDKADYLRDER